MERVHIKFHHFSKCSKFQIAADLGKSPSIFGFWVLGFNWGEMLPVQTGSAEPVAMVAGGSESW